MKLFSAIIKLSGGALILVAVVGFICGLFDYVLVIKGSEMPLVDGPVAIALGVIGIVFFLLGWFMEKKATQKDTGDAAPRLDLNNLDFVERAIKRTRRRNLVIGFFMLVFGGFMFVVPFLDPEADPSSGGSIFLYCLAGLTVFIGGFMMFKGLQLMNIQDSAVYQTIMLEPKTITGLQAQIIQSAYTKHSQQINATLFISTKKIATLSVSETELELLRQYLVKHNPNLQFSQNAQVV